MMTRSRKTIASQTFTLGVFLALAVACGSDTPTPPGGTGEPAPTVVLTVPAHEATGVARNGVITISFSEAMDPATITSSTVTLTQASTNVAGTVTYADGIAAFTPTGALAAGTLYTARISTGAKGLANNALAADYTWSFTTGASSDTVAPTIVLTHPTSSAVGVALNQSVVVTFSEPMNPMTLAAATFSLSQGSSSIAATRSSAGNAATLNPSGLLGAGLIYTVSVTVGVKDMAGNALATGRTWSFTTGATADTSAPTVLSTNPANAALDVAINRSVTATFSEAMNLATLTAATFTLAGPGTTPVAGVVTSLGANVTFTPAAPLAPDTLFHANLSTGVRDLAGNALAAAFGWTFTSSAGATALGPDPVLLGTAADFVILAKSGVTSIPPSAVVGNIGVSPIDSTAVTGFSLTNDASNEFATSGQVTGQVRAADYSSPTPANLTTAVSDMETAYTDAAGRPTPDFSDLGAGEIGGLTLAPGLYRWGTSVTISTSVTLNGGANDVWIFQVSGDVTQASATQITLSGGALAKNIFWQVFGQTMIGTTAHFEGIILCQTSIVLGTGASANGRLLSQTAVSLDQNAVTQPPL